MTVDVINYKNFQSKRRISLSLLSLVSVVALPGARRLPEASRHRLTHPVVAPVFVAFAPVNVLPKPQPPSLVGQLPHVASRHLDPSQRFSYYEAIVKASGAEIMPGHTMVLGLRGVDPHNRRHSSSENAGPYDDTFVVLKKGKRPFVAELLGSTHAGQETSTLSPGGVAQIRPGIFHAVPGGEHEGMPCWQVETRSHDGRLPCYRDVDRDGFISRSEHVGGLTADGILFHNGRFADHGSSIGCQTMPPAIHQRFISLVGKHKSFDYTLVDANVPLSHA